MNKKISVCIVIYKPNFVELESTLTSLIKSSSDYICDVMVVDNSIIATPLWFENVSKKLNFNIRYFHMEDNIGFGAAHNMALNIDSEYHLILNPDVELHKDALKTAFFFMESYSVCGLLTPKANWKSGQQQFLCKNFPAVFDLLLRGFAPKFIKSIFARRLSKYEMSDVIKDDKVYWDPSIVSGCFMLFRTSVWKQLNGFDRRFFLYFEDFDISLRAAKFTKIAYVPSVKIIHHGGHAAKKGWRHIKMFSKSMCTFFNIHGWKWI